MLISSPTVHSLQEVTYLNVIRMDQLISIDLPIVSRILSTYLFNY